MELVLNTKKYEMGKITRAKKKVFDETFDKIRVKAEGGQEFNDDDLDLMVKTIVKLYDDQFTEEEINDDMDVADIIFNYMSVQIQIQGKLNKKIETAKKTFSKGK